MKIEDVPENHWMLLDKKRRNVLFHSENCGEVGREGQKYSIDDIVIERKFTGYII